MVRRRARNTKDVVASIVTSNSLTAQQTYGIHNNAMTTAAAVAVNGAAVNLLEDQYFASPKRKDCKMANTNENLKFTADVVLVYEERRHQQQQLSNNYHNTNNKIKNVNSTCSKSKNTTSGSGRNIGLQLATRSQTRTIENFFKAKNSGAKHDKVHTINEHNMEQKTVSTTGIPFIKQQQLQISPLLAVETEAINVNGKVVENKIDAGQLYMNAHIYEQHEPTPSPPQLTLNGEETSDSDNTEASSTQTNGFNDYQTHRDSHSSSHSSMTENIFLQEPVLKLNIDKSLNQASSIKINKCFDVSTVFSTPPSLSASLLNGRFNQIVTLNSPTKLDTFGCENHIFPTAGTAPAAVSYNGFALEPDSSSCDSGVAFSANSLTTQNGSSPALQLPAARRRKPATPHRILCPSPIKAMPRADTILNGLSPGTRKATAVHKEPLSPRRASQRQLAAASGTCKTRRRLNQPKEQMPYINANLAIQQEQQQDVIVVKINDSTQDDGVVALLDAVEEEFENHEGFKIEPNPKSMLYTVKHATARQYTTNHCNNKQLINKTTKGAKTSKAMHTTQANTTVTNATTGKNINIKTQNKNSLPLAATNGNHELTEYFPVRRSVRKTKSAVKEEMMRNLEQAVIEERAEGLKIAYFEGKGRGVIADRHFKRGEFVIEYIGDLISMTEATEREKRYALDENAGCYMYYFKHKNQQYCIDATIDTGKLGRLVNHSRNGNLVTKVVVVKQRPHLVLLAKEEIIPGEELTYDYGDRSKESLAHHPWLAF